MSADDVRLVKALRSGDADAWPRFVHQTADIVYSAATLVYCKTDAESRALELFERLAGDNFSALAAYDGRASLNVYVGLVLADLLADQIAGLFATDPAQAWVAFEGFYGPDIRHHVRRRFPDHARSDGDGHDDLYHDVLLHLVEDDFRRLKSYKGAGSFSGFVRRLVRNQCEDIARRQAGRRRLPTAIATLGELEQAVYRELAWNGTRREDLARKLGFADGGVMPGALAVALRRVDPIVSRMAGPADARRRPPALSLDDEKGAGAAVARSLEDGGLNPEESLMRREDDTVMEAAIDALMAAMDALPEEGRIYLILRFLEDPPLKPRQIAPLLGIPLQELYRQRSRWENTLLASLREKGVEEFPGLSV